MCKPWSLCLHIIPNTQQIKKELVKMLSQRSKWYQIWSLHLEKKTLGSFEKKGELHFIDYKAAPWYSYFLLSQVWFLAV
jgi:hypothetical protein